MGLPRYSPIPSAQYPMVARARWLAPADARRRGLFWLLLFCCISVNNSNLANEIHHASNAPPSGSTASPAPSSTCANYRPFLCYAYEGLNQPYPEWLQQSDAKCSPCTMDTPCDNTKAITGNEGDVRAAVLAKCRPQFCKDESASAVETDCIQPVSVNGGKVFFPFNVCTREMVAFGECDGKKLSTKFFVPSSNQLSTEYMVQCDAGFTIPKLVVDARDADSSAESQRQKLTCVPSLQQAAGFLKDDPSPLQNYPYDVSNLLDFKYCEKGGRPHKESTCQPLPLCENDNKTPTPPFGPGTVQPATDCDLPCHYEYGRMNYSDCVFLDIVDAGAKRSFSAWRGMSGPWAEFMSEEETVMVDVNRGIVPEPKPYGRWQRMANRHIERKFRSDDAQQIVRMSREGQSQTIRYPKCINSTLLLEMDRGRVEGDLMLNCKTNIFVQLLGEEGMVMEPPPCDRYEDMRICSNRVQPVFDNSTLPAADVNYCSPHCHLEVAIGTVLLATFIATASLYCVYRKRTEWPAEPLPHLPLAANIVLEEQVLENDWMNKFDHVISGKPLPCPRRGTLGLTHEKHVALQLKELPQCPANVPLQKQIISGTPDDPLAIAKTFFDELAHGYYVSERNGMPRRTFDHAELQTLFEHARNIVKWSDGVARVTGPTWIVGDIHGDFNTLVRVFAAYSQKASPGQNIVFLGDIVDRGKRQLMSVVLIVSAYVLYPKQIFYVRGNHELPEVHILYGFPQELFDDGYTFECIDAVRSFFELLPIFALIDKRILAMHGGLCPEFAHELVRDGFDPTEDKFEDLVCGTLWSDPNHHVKSYDWNYGRHVAYYYGQDAILEVRQKLGIDFIVRAHQQMKTGARFFGDWLISVYTTCWRAGGPQTTEEKKKEEAEEKKEENKEEKTDENKKKEKETEKEKAAKQEALLQEFTKEGTAARKQVIDEEEAPAQIGGVVVYDGSKLRMLHFIPTDTHYDTHEEFAEEFDGKVAGELEFTENCEKPIFTGGPQPKSESKKSTGSVSDKTMMEILEKK